MKYNKNNLIELEEMAYLQSLDDETLPYNERINHIIDCIEEDVGYLIYRTNEVGYIHEDEFTKAFNLLHEALYKFMFQISDIERIIVFRRNYVLYEFSDLCGELCLSKIQDENGYIEDKITSKKEEVDNIRHDMQHMEQNMNIIKKQIELFKSFKEEE